MRATNRLSEAEPLYRRALAIDEKSFGPDHPNVARDLNNLAELLRATNRLSVAFLEVASPKGSRFSERAVVAAVRLGFN
jgi:hypothetical protein